LLLRRAGRMTENADTAVNAVIVHVPLPAVTPR
jgi:hypothetical protein